MNVGETLNEISKVIEALQVSLRSIDKVSETVRGTNIVFLKCENCGKLFTVSRSSYYKDKSCRNCRSSNVVKLSKTEFIEALKNEKRREVLTELEFAELCRDLLLKCVDRNIYMTGVYFHVNFLRFNFEDYITMLLHRRLIEIYFRYFRKDREFEVLKVFASLIKYFKVLLNEIKTVRIILDSRDLFCLEKGEVLKNIGFVKELDFVAEIELNKLDEFIQRLEKLFMMTDQATEK